MFKLRPPLPGVEQSLRTVLVTLAALSFAMTPGAAQDWTSARPDGHAPIGVMGDHTHSAGEMMLSYRFMRMGMEGNRVDTESVPPDAVLDDYMVTPLDMPMTMHMIGLMVAPSNRLTLMAMVPWIAADMAHRTRTSAEFTTASSGLGDVKLSGLVRLFNANRQAVHLNLGVSLPTGSVDETDITPASAPDEAVLPYPMQLGSGTFDALPGITYLGQGDRLSWGLQAMGTVRLGENHREYRLGNRGLGTGWLAARLNDWTSVSARAELTAWGDIEGADPALNPAMVPTADPSLRSGKRADVGVGFNFEVPRGGLDGNRLAVEALFPVWQDLSGPQLETDWTVTVGWQYAFQLWGEHH